MCVCVRVIFYSWYFVLRITRVDSVGLNVLGIAFTSTFKRCCQFWVSDLIFLPKIKMLLWCGYMFFIGKLWSTSRVVCDVRLTGNQHFNNDYRETFYGSHFGHDCVFCNPIQKGTLNGAHHWSQPSIFFFFQYIDLYLSQNPWCSSISGWVKQAECLTTVHDPTLVRSLSRHPCELHVVTPLATRWSEEVQMQMAV